MFFLGSCFVLLLLEELIRGRSSVGDHQLHSYSQNTKKKTKPVFTYILSILVRISNVHLSICLPMYMNIYIFNWVWHTLLSCIVMVSSCFRINVITSFVNWPQLFYFFLIMLWIDYGKIVCRFFW